MCENAYCTYMKRTWSVQPTILSMPLLWLQQNCDLSRCLNSVSKLNKFSQDLNYEVIIFWGNGLLVTWKWQWIIAFQTLKNASACNKQQTGSTPLPEPRINHPVHICIYMYIYICIYISWKTPFTNMDQLLLWDEITYPFQNFSGAAIEIWEVCDFLFMLGFNWISICKRGPRSQRV